MDGDQLVEASLSDLLEASITVLGNRARTRANIVTAFQPDVPALYCQSGKLSQVFMNIIVNARAGDGEPVGRCRAAGSPRGIGPRDRRRWRGPRSGGPHPGQWHGHGRGDPAAHFRPFYTTKEMGKGTGLGLSIVKGILDDHHADVAVDSTVGEGTSFSLTFPLDHRPEPH